MHSFSLFQDDISLSTYDFKIFPDEIHIWSASIEDSLYRLDSLEKVLSMDEVRRANCFYFKRDYNRYIVTHSILRIILGLYAKCSPDSLCFRFNEYGKPALMEWMNDSELCFNLSHSCDQILFAITSGHEVGVDIEHVRPFKSAAQIVERFFSEKEKEEFRKLPEQLKEEAFFTCWTRKEAYIKARGQGMTLPLDHFSVLFLSGETTISLPEEHESEDKELWSIKSITTVAGYIAAIAIQGRIKRLWSRQWPLLFDPAKGE